MTSQIATPLVAPLAALTGWLQSAGVDAVIIGGVAVSLLARPRFTQDIDTLVRMGDVEVDWQQLIDGAAAYGIVPRIEQPLQFARRARVLLLRHAASQIDIDVILGALPFEHGAIAHGQSYTIGGVQLRLPRVEDLLVMKAVAHRPQDMQDIEQLLQANPGVDVESARRWVREFAVAAARPELLADFDAAVSRQLPQR